MISCYFGLPGCGKTSILARLAVSEQKKIDLGISRYKYVYSNVPVLYPGIRQFFKNDLGNVDIRDALVLCDEATLFADCRNHKQFPEELTYFFMMHRHYKCDFVYFTQFFDSVDKRMRTVTERLYYVKRGLFGRTSYMRIPKAIIIPKDTGDIVEGYRMPNFIERLFLRRAFFRRPYYKFFDSFVELKPLEVKKFPDWYPLRSQLAWRLRSVALLLSFRLLLDKSRRK